MDFKAFNGRRFKRISRKIDNLTIIIICENLFKRFQTVVIKKVTPYIYNVFGFYIAVYTPMPFTFRTFIASILAA